ncbi:MAG TPA: hypothetical protein VJ978_07395, partial [Nitriliruptoraceae bacterium]|nr:hypothetical protein [Nitriliruptoraceae bacterium]
LAPVGDDSGTLQAEKEATRSRSLVNDGVEADVADDAETLAQEKAAAADGDDWLANEKASILSGRDQVEPAPSNDDLVLQGEKEAALDRGVIAAAPPPDVAGSDQRFHNQAAVLAAGPDVASQQDETASLQDEKEHAQADRSVVEPAVDEAETLQQEKEHAQANRGGESSSVVDDSVALQGEKEQRLDRTQPGETGSSQVDDGARAAREKAAAAPVVQRQPRPGDPVLPPPRF